MPCKNIPGTLPVFQFGVLTAISNFRWNVPDSKRNIASIPPNILPRLQLTLAEFHPGIPPELLPIFQSIFQWSFFWYSSGTIPPWNFTGITAGIILLEYHKISIGIIAGSPPEFWFIPEDHRRTIHCLCSELCYKWLYQ